jgi:hypothetical protein
LRGSRPDHLDQLVDYPRRNRFLKTVVPFLKSTMRSAQGTPATG